MKEKIDYKKIILCLISGILCFIAISYNPQYELLSVYKQKGGLLYKFIADLRYNTNGFGIESSLITIAFSYLIYKKYNKEKFNVKHLGAIIFSLCCIVGKCILNVDNLDVIFSSLFNFFMTILAFFGYFILFKLAFDFIFLLIKKKEIKISNKKIKKVYDYIFECHPFLMPLVILFICYLPYIIITFPGTLFVDALNQLRMYDGLRAFTNHHPVISTYLMGTIFNFGKNLVNQNFGIFLYVIIQFIVQLIIYSWVFVVYKKENVKNYMRVITLIYMALFCVLKIYAVTIVKDTYFSLFFILFFIAIYYFSKRNREKVDKKTIYQVLIAGILIYIFRNNGYHIVLASLFCLIFLNKNKKHILTVLGMIAFFIIINFGYHNLMLPALNIQEGGAREMLSVPLQQTARYLKYYDYDLDPNDRNTLKKVFKVSLNEIKNVYNPQNADPVKSRFDTNCDMSCGKKFIKVWAVNLTKHPKVYIDAYVSNYSGYLYPSVNEHVNYKRDINGLGNYLLEKYKTKEYNFKFINKKGVSTLQNIAYTKKQVPILGLIYSNGFYTWLLIILALYIIHLKEYKRLLVISPIIITWLFLFLGPIDAYLRYVYPIMVPILLAFALLTSENAVKSPVK